MSPPRLIEFQGHTNTIAGWSRKLGISHVTLHMRFKNGWTVKRALTTPARAPRVAKPAPLPAAMPTAFDKMKRANLVQQRELTRMLRQFSRDFALIMERSLDRGVVEFAADLPSDRSLPVARERL
ncbi:hypothetical protein V1281_001009 [Nitrobacteraceae bacterium AZCC 2161]